MPSDGENGMRAARKTASIMLGIVIIEGWFLSLSVQRSTREHVIALYDPVPAGWLACVLAAMIVALFVWHAIHAFPQIGVQLTAATQAPRRAVRADHRVDGRIAVPQGGDGLGSDAGRRSAAAGSRVGVAFRAGSRDLGRVRRPMASRYRLDDRDRRTGYRAGNGLSRRRTGCRSVYGRK
jgi:hypothetical protein